MEFAAHIRESDKKVQSVKEHCENVSTLAEQFSVELLKPFAKSLGSIHDIGKYSKRFQRRIHNENVQFEHSACGAIELEKLAKQGSMYQKLYAPMLEYCAAGHHTGLPDGGTQADSPDNDVTLSARLMRQKNYIGECDYSAYKSDIQAEIPDSADLFSEFSKCGSDYEAMIEKYAFFTRYLFSCLTDADFLDTEKFCQPEQVRQLSADFDKAAEALEEHMRSLLSDTPLKAARGRIQAQAFTNNCGSNISILNMPTGSGKTLCSLKLALDMKRASPDIERIIYVIPYTSIIEQTADLFEKIIGEYADILQHHSNYCFEDKNEPTTAEKLKKAAENWDSPFVVTTSVQFFRSLYDYKGSGLRKLHNIAHSVIVFDEIHLLPIEYLKPCIRGIGYITQYLGSKAILLSATMPDYEKLFKKYIPDCSLAELITDKSDFSYFKKCRFINMGKTDSDNVIKKSGEYNSSLIIVNSRKLAREIYNSIGQDKYHLSTYMTPDDRSKTIAKIRRDLEQKKKITVVSTSLIEAGVDLDFEAVFRQLAGLDNILQAAGRCNRGGERDFGDVYVFETDDSLKGDLQIRANIARSLLEEYEDISSAECIEEYYNRLIYSNKNQIDNQSIACFNNVKCTCAGIPFRSYAQQFKFIKDDAIGVVVDNCEEAHELIVRLKNGDFSVKRSLQKYTVALKAHGEFDKALKSGIVDDFGTGVYILTSPENYNSETGLDIDKSDDIIF